jgi:hypothetical protein
VSYLSTPPLAHWHTGTVVHGVSERAARKALAVLHTDRAKGSSVRKFYPHGSEISGCLLFFFFSGRATPRRSAMACFVSRFFSG